MGLRKCPKCELNYIKDDEQVCYVCRRYMKGEAESDDGVVMCSECGENPAVRGGDLCAICLREARRQENLEKLADAMTPDEPADVDDIDDIDDIDNLEVPIDNGDIPERELEEIDKELGGDDAEEEEEEPIDESPED